MEKLIAVIKKYTGRKFLTAFTAELAGLFALFGHANLGSTVANAILKGGALLAIVLTAGLYAAAEGKVDAAALEVKAAEAYANAANGGNGTPNLVVEDGQDGE